MSGITGCFTPSETLEPPPVRSSAATSGSAGCTDHVICYLTRFVRSLLDRIDRMGTALVVGLTTCRDLSDVEVET